MHNAASYIISSSLQVINAVRTYRALDPNHFYTLPSFPCLLHSAGSACIPFPYRRCAYCSSKVLLTYRKIFLMLLVIASTEYSTYICSIYTIFSNLVVFLTGRTCLILSVVCLFFLPQNPIDFKCNFFSPSLFHLCVSLIYRTIILTNVQLFAVQVCATVKVSMVLTSVLCVDQDMGRGKRLYFALCAEVGPYPKAGNVGW